MCAMREVHSCNVHPSLDHFLGHLHRPGGRSYIGTSNEYRETRRLNMTFTARWTFQTLINGLLVHREQLNVPGQHVWPIVQTMPVLRDSAGSESMSNRHKCSMKVSAMAACICWLLMMEEPASFAFDMTGSVSLGKSYEDRERNETCDKWVPIHKLVSHLLKFIQILFMGHQQKSWQSGFSQPRRSYRDNKILHNNVAGNWDACQWGETEKYLNYVNGKYGLLLNVLQQRHLLYPLTFQ